MAFFMHDDILKYTDSRKRHRNPESLLTEVGKGHQDSALSAVMLRRDTDRFVLYRSSVTNRESKSFLHKEFVEHIETMKARNEIQIESDSSLDVSILGVQFTLLRSVYTAKILSQARGDISCSEANGIRTRIAVLRTTQRDLQARRGSLPKANLPLRHHLTQQISDIEVAIYLAQAGLALTQPFAMLNDSLDIERSRGYMDRSGLMMEIREVDMLAGEYFP
jgi:hypothetical protein